MLTRLSDRTRAPRFWWFPEEAQVAIEPRDLQKLHRECSETIRRTSLILLGLCIFSLVSLGATDESLLGLGKTIKPPFANTEISFLAFLYLVPVILVATALYLHVFVGKWIYYSSTGLQADKKLLTIFNIDEPVPRFFSGVLFYWQVVLVLFVLTWKALPRPDAPHFVILSCAVTAGFIFLRIRRQPGASRHWNRLLWVALAADIALFLYAASVITYGGKLLLTRNLYLYGAKLQNVDLRRFQMRDADMREAKLSGASLIGAELSGANLSGADLTGANLIRAGLNAANLRGANLTSAYLSRANSTGANLRGSNLSRAYLSGADLSKADLRGANLSGADLREANVRSAYLSRANLTKADLRGINLSGADLSGADLSGANLSRAIVNKANLSGANLREANLSGAILTNSDLRYAAVDILGLCRAREMKAVELNSDHKAAVNQNCPSLLTE